MHEDVTRDLALEAALKLFWAKGAEVAAYGEIVKATGLSRKALYAHWPDKQTLVAETLALYRREVLAGMIDTLTGQGVIAFWDRIEAAIRAPGWCGCYLMRTGSGPLRRDTAVSAALVEYLDRLQAAFEAALAGQRVPVEPALAASQCVAILALISQRGAVEGAARRSLHFWRQAGRRPVCKPRKDRLATRRFEVDQTIRPTWNLSPISSGSVCPLG
jgi:TetR/AcrR family transcriptional regulator, transcriptional repressor for nem operon